MNKKPDDLNYHPRGSTLRLALRARAAVRRRDHALEETILAFDSSALRHIRDEDRFAQALEDAETADSLADAMALHEADIEDWAAESMALLRTLQSADEAYEREFDEALDHFRNAVTGSTEGNDDPPLVL
jgi:MoxR-like ATPase